MADRILADPSRRRVFEKENLYNLLELPKNRPRPISSQRNTETNDSEQEEGEIQVEPKTKVKVRKLTQKRIKKDKKYCEYEAKQTKRLLEEPVEDQQVEEKKKDKWCDLMAKIFEHNEDETGS